MENKNLSNLQYKAWRSFHLFRTKLLKHLTSKLNEHSGLTEAEYIILITLFESKDSVLQAKELSISIGWEISRLSHQITRMEKSGLVEREIYKKDIRSYQVKITALGKKIIKKAFPIQELEVKHCFGDVLNESQLNSLIEISDIICKHLEEEHGA